MNVERPGISWSTPLDACVLIAKGATFRTASKIALVVGTLLALVNQGSLIASGDASLATWVRTVANYVIPYAVASVGYLTPFRRR
ncbi:MAG: nitrate/nitrite transporter NrtS [Ilumatobacteraceae bacterium]